MTVNRFYLFMTALYLLIAVPALIAWAVAGVEELVIPVVIVGVVLFGTMLAAHCYYRKRPY